MGESGTTRFRKSGDSRAGDSSKAEIIAQRGLGNCEGGVLLEESGRGRIWSVVEWDYRQEGFPSFVAQSQEQLGHE